MVVRVLMAKLKRFATGRGKKTQVYVSCGGIMVSKVSTGGILRVVLIFGLFE